MGRSLAPPELRDSRRHVVVDLSSLSTELPPSPWEQSGVNAAAEAVQREWGQGAVTPKRRCSERAHAVSKL